MSDEDDTNLPSPDFSARPLGCVSGIRPFRRSGYRLEQERIASSPDKFIVHNYGHGGAGISLSWGTSSKVRDIVRAHLTTTADRKVAVLGSGVMGLTAATLLVDLGLQVTVYAEKFWKDTTSAAAGGQWAPSIVGYADRVEFAQVLETSYKTFKDSIGKGFGVFERPTYAAALSPGFELVFQLVPGLLPPRKDLPRLPFEHHTKPGYLYLTLLIEPPIFLKKLDGDLRGKGVAFVNRTFQDVASVLQLQENIIINCTGIGAKELWNDAAMQPIKGQLALLPPQPDLTYLYSQNGYMFPRSDAVAIGGSFEEDESTPGADPACCRLLVDYLKGQFGQGPEIPFPDCHIHHPLNRPRVAAEEAAAG